MSHGHDCQIKSSQCIIWEITEFLLNIRNKSHETSYKNCCMHIFLGCKKRIYHYEFKLDAWNNGWKNKEAKIFWRNSVISRTIHWLDWIWQSWPWDIYSLSTNTFISILELNDFFHKLPNSCKLQWFKRPSMAPMVILEFNFMINECQKH